MIKGHCLCGTVSFEIDPEGIVLFNNCYCKSCQRNAGTGYVSQIQVLRSSFHWLGGEQDLKQFESSPGVNRAFCRHCGSRMPQTEIPGDFVPVPAGVLNENPGQLPEVNMHLNAKAPWALVDESIDGVEDQGSPEFWEHFMKRKQNNSRKDRRPT